MCSLLRAVRFRRLAMFAGVGLISVATTIGGTIASGPAKATNVNIGAGNGICPNPRNAWCLFFSPNEQNGVWGSSTIDVHTITANFSDGDGPVRNNAASAINDIPACTIRIWVFPGYTGNSNSLPGQELGNLTSGSVQLRNNEASVDEFSCP